MKINVFDDMYQYKFDGEEKKLGLNIYCYIKNNEAIMFDSGYETNFLEVKNDLDSKGIKLVKLVMTHYHPDHIGGITHCKDIETVGSVYAEETLSKFYDDYSELLPNISVSEKTSFEFHGDTITLIPNPSHSKCTMIIKVKKFIFAADDVMFFDSDEQCIPYCADEVEMHLEGLRRFRRMAEGNLLLPSHGKATKCTLYPKFSIMYLRHILKDPNISFADFEELYKTNFRNGKWHKLNCSKVEGYSNSF